MLKKHVKCLENRKKIVFNAQERGKMMYFIWENSEKRFLSLKSSGNVFVYQKTLYRCEHPVHALIPGFCYKWLP